MRRRAGMEDRRRHSTDSTASRDLGEPASLRRGLWRKGVSKDKGHFHWGTEGGEGLGRSGGHTASGTHKEGWAWSWLVLLHPLLAQGRHRAGSCKVCRGGRGVMKGDNGPEMVGGHHGKFWRKVCPGLASRAEGPEGR